MSAFTRLRFASWGALLTAAACANVLSLEDAEVDPSLGATGDEAHGEGGIGGGGGGDGTPDAPDCHVYCDGVMQRCQGPFAVYTSVESCLAVCAALEPGTMGDESGNTVGCRMRHGAVAAAEPSFYCPIAGPSGNGVCGSPCDALCTLAGAACTNGTNPWPDEAACREACITLPGLGTYSVDPALEMYQGPHVECRLFHVVAATLGDPAPHCMHAGGAPPCVAATD